MTSRQDAAVTSGRFAPSPSGDLHLGNLRTALISWLCARSTGRQFLVRMEDLDRERTRPGADVRQLADLASLGLDWDGEVVYQSKRFELYDAAMDSLTANGLVYECFCTRREIREASSAPQRTEELRYPGTCRKLSAATRARMVREGRRPALRLAAKGNPVVIEDAMHPRYQATPDDIVLRRNDGLPAYNLAVVVDDAEQSIDQVVRGDDLLASTPSQVHLADLLHLPRPTYVHVPLAHNQSGQRLAKRDGAVTLADLATQGVRPERVLAWLAASLNLADIDDSVTTAELLRRFDLDRLPRDAWRVGNAAQERGVSRGNQPEI